MPENFYKFIEEKASWLRRETIKIHRYAPQTRLASALSTIEIFTVLYCAKVLSFKEGNPQWKNRDRLIVSKGHGAFSLYPIFADIGFIEEKQISCVCADGSLFGSIPDPSVCGFETINGSLGHGLGVGCGIALALKIKKQSQKVFVLCGDGELNEGSVWEAVMFARQHKLGNLILIVDNNKISMLDYCKNIIDLEPYEEKFRAFGWRAERTDGHNIKKLNSVLRRLKQDNSVVPKVLIADTVKGKGVGVLENNRLSHIRSLTPQEADQIILR